MKKIIFSISLLATTATAFSQQPVVISAGGGMNRNNQGNGYNIQANVFVPFLNKNRFTLGVLAGGMYLTAKDPAPQAPEYKLYNGSLNISNAQNGETSGSLTGHLGLQADLSLGAFILSPSISGGYFHLKQNGFAQTTTITNNGTQQAITLVDRPEAKRSGFVTIPQLKISLPLAKTLSIYASAGLNMGPKMTIEQRKLEPAGGFNENNTYEPAQLSAGRMVAQPAEVNYRSFMLGAGVSWRLGSKNKRSQTDTARNPLYEDGGHNAQNPMAEAARPGSPIGGIVVKGGKNPGGNLMVAVSNNNGVFEFNNLETGIYRFTLEMAAREGTRTYTGGRKNEPQGKNTNEKGTAKKDIRTYTGGRKNEPQGKSISEQGVKRNEATEAARPGSPIGGIVVKGGKKPGGGMSHLTVDKDGSIQFEVLEAGNYKFLIETGEKVKVKENRRSGLKDVVKTQV